MKFLISEEAAQAVSERVRGPMALDPHGDPALGGAYRTTTLYCDTPALDVYRRIGAHKRRKYRLRRYGDEPRIYLELKAKWDERVEKRRSEVPRVEVERLEREELPADWAGFWFHRRLRARQLRPVCQVSYERVAFMGGDVSVPLRLTLDRRLRCLPAGGWLPGVWEDGQQYLTGGVILEFKFRMFLPVLFKELIWEMGLVPSTVSKYRRGVQTLGLAGDAGPSHEREEAG
jgi:hypothetical protein